MWPAASRLLLHVGCGFLLNRQYGFVGAVRSFQTEMEEAVAVEQSSAMQAAYAWAGKQCEQHLWMTLDTCLKELDDSTSYVITGDIDAMWTRDSTAQLWPYLLLIEQRASNHEEHEASSLQHLERLLAGALRRQAKFLLTDPYANAYTDKWDSASDERLGRGGYTFTGNYEVDSGVYFLRFFTRMAERELKQPQPRKMEQSILQRFITKVTGRRVKQDSRQGSLLQDPTMRGAVTVLIALYRQERDHALGKSQYMYPLSEPWELPGHDGRGNPANWTGMVWGGFRPSDDAQTYAYHIPSNLFLASVLGPLSQLAEKHWENSGKLVAAMKDLRHTIIEGVHKHGMVPASKAHMKGKEDAGKKVYCYEVDGLGNCLLMDDANVPSLLSLPYLDPSSSVYDKEVYRTTRKFVLSEHNKWYFKGKVAAGVGSPHTSRNKIWPLSMVMQAMTSSDQTEKDSILQTLFKVQAQSNVAKGLTESFDKDDASLITRPWFGWPNALLAEYLMTQEPSRCSPSLSELQAHLPTSLVATDKGFYPTPVAKQRRDGVVLPTSEYYPS